MVISSTSTTAPPAVVIVWPGACAKSKLPTTVTNWETMISACETSAVNPAGASAAGTEFVGTAYSVAPNSAYDWYGLARLDVGEYLVGLASAATSLTFEAEGELGIAG